MKKILLIILTFFIFPQVSFGANLHYRDSINQNYSTSDGMFYSPAYVSGSYYSTAFATTTGNEKFLYIKRISGNSCITITSGTVSLYNTSGVAISSISGGEIFNTDYCKFNISTTTAGLSIAGISFTGQFLGNVGTLTLDGSNSNSGSTFDGNGLNPVAGGFAFWITDINGYSEPLPPCDIYSCIISLIPLDNATTTNPVTFSMEYYIHPNDLGNFTGIRVSLRNIDQNTLFGELTSFFNPNDITFLDQVSATSSGTFIFTATSTLANGNYRIHAELEPTFLNFFSNIFSANQYVTIDHQFIVGESTFIGNISQNSFIAINSIFASTTATSTLVLSNSCNVLSGFDVNKCLAYLFIPDSKQIKDTINSFKDNVLTRFPLGYATNLVTIFSTSTQGTLTLLSGTIPQTISNGGTQFSLDLNGVLDPILNATSSIFATATENDSRTFFEITNDYWEKILYFFLILYMLRRIFGSFFHINAFGKQGSLSDTSNKDDSYALKEKLYKSSYRGMGGYGPFKEDINNPKNR